MGRPLVGVFPLEYLQTRQRLFSALSSALAVDFAPRQAGEQRGLDAAIVAADATDSGVVAAGIPSLCLDGGQEGGLGRPGIITLAASRHLDDRLHHRRILEHHASETTPLGEGHGTVLATGPSGPVWRVSEVGGAVAHEVTSGLDELAPTERLKDRLRAGRFISLLPIVQFLRNIDPVSWERPPPRACFIFDDANLHWRSYGYLRYATLSERAAAGGYHAAVAMIPLDSWLARKEEVALFQPRGALSLLVHGNDHTRGEVGALVGEEAGLRLAATAWQRVERFERRARLPVSRVMSPPHGSISTTMMSALRRVGFDATAYWGPTDEAPQALVGWNMADVDCGGGFPGIHRVPIDAPLDELLLRVYLDQPLLLSGHHIDLAGGFDVLDEAAARVNEIGHVTWSSVGDALRSNVLTRQEGEVMRVRPFSRDVDLALPPGASSLVVEWPGQLKDGGSWVVLSGGSVRAPTPCDRFGETGPIPVNGHVRLRQTSDDAVNPASIGAAPWRPWPIARRCMTEGRDRLLPLLRPVHARRVPP